MSNPFLQTVSNPQSPAAGVFETGIKGSSNNRSGSEQESPAFSEVLGSTQQVHQHGNAPSSDSAGANHPSHQPVNHEEPQTFAESTQPLADGIVNSQFSGQVLPEYDIQHFQGQVLNDGVNLGTKANSEIFVQSSLASHVSGKQASLPFPNSLNTGIPNGSSVETRVPFHIPPQSGQGTQGGSATQVGQPLVGLTPPEVAVDSLGGRLRPLLVSNPTAPSDLGSPVVSSITTANQTSATVQLAVTQLGTVGDGQTIGGATLGVNRVNPVLEELSQTINRGEQSGKPSDSIGTTQVGQAGLGGAGHDIPFGNQTGNGFSQLTDSSQGTQISIQQGQVPGKVGSFDERLQMLHSSPPQRLQIDVQLSETARAQVDVAVQQRNVYAGVMMDNPVLRNLAQQNVQQLEEQLGQADMDLQEFDVHEEHEQLGEQRTGEHSKHERAFSGVLDARESLSGMQSPERSFVSDHSPGWHLVA